MITNKNLKFLSAALPLISGWLYLANVIVDVANVFVFLWVWSAQNLTPRAYFRLRAESQYIKSTREGRATKLRGARAEARVRAPQSLHLKTINLHNFTFSLAVRGSCGLGLPRRGTGRHDTQSIKRLKADDLVSLRQTAKVRFKLRIS